MTSYPCPACLAEANLETGCPGCGRGPDPLAAEVIQLDVQIAELRPKLATAHAAVAQAQSAYTALAGLMQAAQRRRTQIAAQVWAAAHAPGPAAHVAKAARPETSTQTVKNVLFVLGGILLSIAAIVFTAFAWGTFGMAGKAIILAVITAATLGVPVLTLRRGLRGTAETFAALGLLLVALDGYSIWRVDLGGVQAQVSGWTYAGIVAGITAAVAVLYGRMTRLTGPAYIGLVVGQPVLPLVFATLIDGRATGFAFVFSAVAAANLPVVRLRFSPLQLLSAMAYAVSLALAHGYAFATLYQATSASALAVAGGATLLAGAVAVAGPVLRPQSLWLTASSAWFTGLVVLVGLVTAVRLDPGDARLWTIGLIAALAVVTALAELGGRGAAWRGMLIGVAAAGAVAGFLIFGYVVGTAVLRDTDNVTIEVILLTAAGVIVTRRVQPAAAGAIGVAGTVAVALAMPAGYVSDRLPPAADLTATALLLTALLWFRPPDVVRALIGVGVAVLSGHAVLASGDRPALLAYTLGVTAILAAGTALVGWWRDRIAGVAAMAVTAPLAVGLSAAVAWTVHSDVIHTMALTAAALPLAAWAVHRWYPRSAELSARATILAAVLIAVTVPGDPWTKSVYVAGGAVALAVLPRTGVAERIAGWAVLGLALAIARPPLFPVLEPYTWLLGGQSTPTAGLADVVSIAVIVATLWTYRPALYCALPVPTALALVHFGLVWPWLPLFLLIAGLALVLYAVWRAPWCAAVGLVLAGSGLSGLSIEYWSLITGLSLVCACALGLALFTAIRRPSWAVFGVAWIGLAITSGYAARLTDRGIAFTVLFAAAALLLGSVFVPRPGIRVLEIPAHLAAVGVIATVPSAVRLSEACLVWGVALGLSVFARLSAAWRYEWLLRLSLAGALEVTALWALLISRDVQAVEAYSLPLAGVALLVGFLALRRDPSLTSWIGYGPALVAAFGPTLAVILPVPGDPVRRLALGAGALIVVIAGSVRRRQAPVVLGGAVLIVVALHEVTQVWSSLPLWLPIGAGGGILVAVAITYERRLRDLRSLRTRLSSYT